MDEKKEIKSISNIWDKKGGVLIKPAILLAEDRAGGKYFVIQDNSTIVYLIKDATNTTFVIPKKYCQREHDSDYYKIYNIEKLTPVSCPRKNDYELFVQKYLIK